LLCLGFLFVCLFVCLFGVVVVFVVVVVVVEYYFFLKIIIVEPLEPWLPRGAWTGSTFLSKMATAPQRECGRSKCVDLLLLLAGRVRPVLQKIKLLAHRRFSL